VVIVRPVVPSKAGMLDLQLLTNSVPTLAWAALVTIKLTACSVVLSLLFGTLSVMLQLSRIPGGYWVSRAYVSAMRNTPLLVQLFVVFFGLGLSGIKGQGFIAASLAIGLNSGAYTTEILRAAILNVPAGHIEAAEAIGMSRFWIWLRVILPQAFFVSLPALTNEFTIVLKSTPLAAVVAVTELTYQGVLIQSRTSHAIEIFIPMAAGYILIALAVTRFSRWLERRYRLLHA
jgi:polar amino acid transport system permease protein